MIELRKYHKQSQPKQRIKALTELNKMFNLGFNPKSDFDLLWLEVFETSLFNKKTLEEGFESIRTAHFDMWDNLMFKERNFILKCDLAEVKSKLKAFKHEGKPIYIAFFDTLLNSLYDKEIAILELPQYFKLYHEFSERMIPVSTYGLKPLSANMTSSECLHEDPTQCILFNRNLNIFYRATMQGCDTYPLLETCTVPPELLGELVSALVHHEDLRFIELAHSQALLSVQCMKKIDKIYAKEEKKRRKSHGIK